MIEFTHTIIDRDPKVSSAYHQSVVEHGGYVSKLETIERESARAGVAFRMETFRMTVRFKDALAAAAFLASQSDDKERAAQFKMFWGGE